MGPFNVGRVHHGQGILDRPILGISVRIGRNVRRWITPGGIGYASVSSSEVMHLRIPASMVTRELVDEKDRRTATSNLNVESHLVVSHGPDVIDLHFDI